VRRPVLRLLPFCLAIACTARAQELADANWDLCPAPEGLPLFQPLPEGDKPGKGTPQPTDIDAEKLDVSEKNVTVLTGDVELRRGEQWLGTDKLTYRHESETFVTEGPVRFQDRTFRFRAAKAEGNQKAETLRLEDVQYQFNENLGNGRADAITIVDEQGRLEGATYSTCPPGQRQWEFAAGRIDIDQEEGMGSARNATLRLGGVPVLWLPYIRFPTDDRRRTGLLMPKIGYDSEDGFEYEQPIYLNLAPNYDATLKPRLITERGLMLGGEFRYLFENHQGEVDATWLPDDDVYGGDRGLASLRHHSSLGPHWYADANLNHVSDVHYFEDFGDNLASTSISLVTSRAGVYGRGVGWTASLEAQDWQIATPYLPPGAEPYRELPALRASFVRPLAPWVEVGVSGDAIRFTHDTLDGGDRIDVRPFVRFPFGGAAWYATPEFAWRYTAYSLDDSLVPPGGDDSPTRSVPVMSLDAGAFFEREFQWRDSDLIQTLEPRLFYLNVPYREQDDLPLFDTHPLTFGWPGLFRTNRFSGGDRQADADQLTVALTTRVLDADDGRELISAGIGRIHYFDEPRVTLPGSLPLGDEGSAWVAEATVAVSQRWHIGVAHQWDPDDSRTDLSAIRSQWRFARGGLLNAAYRYRAEEIEQTDVSFVLPINARWSVMGRWNYSLLDDETLEAMGGFEWRSCCVALRVLAREYIREFSGEKKSGIYFELELNGVGGLGRNTVRVLDDAILDYSEYVR
jgi:LPS-assembly protein